MSALTVAEERATAALSKLERALATRSPAALPVRIMSATTWSAIAICCGASATAAAPARGRGRARRPAGRVSAEVEGRLDGAITQLDELTGEQGAAR